MYVFGHDHVPCEQEIVLLAYFVEGLDENFAGARCAQERLAVITTEGYEVKIATSVVALKRVAHEH
jgi:hypothetical protein